MPLHIKGTGRLWPRGAKRIYTGETKVTFGAPIIPDLPARQLVGHLEEAIAALADEATTDWWSARRRAAAGTTPALTGPDASPGAGLGRSGRRPRTAPGGAGGRETMAAQA